MAIDDSNSPPEFNNPRPIVPSSNSAGSSMTDDTNTIFQTGSIGSITSAIGNSIYGINHRQTPGAIQINKDFFGLTFFTRPELNLTTENVRSVRQLAPLLTNNEYSIQRIIRCLLDRNLASNSNIKSQLVDNEQAFIPMLTNHLLSISGWPDVVAPTLTSQEGIYKEAFSLIDGVTVNYSTYDIQANFRNIPGDPITLLFLVWIHYASYVYQGVMVPYPDKIIENEVDYNTRIYRLVLDNSKRFIKKIAATGAAFPTSSPIGAAFNYEHDKPINSSNDQISIPFRCMGALYQDDILIDEFNRTTAFFNGPMDADAIAIEKRLANIQLNAKKEEVSSQAFRNKIKMANKGNMYTKIDVDELALFNNKGYPHINIDTYELGWYVSNDVYNYMLPLLA
jgi:hypothetical protein